ncbi:MAG: DUF1801 domain-containing protein [Bacteroidota bacterium]|nr:DUF1801 domain-containing protein [Bacteroidota bacterium]
MQIAAKNPDDYIKKVAEDKREAIIKLRAEILKNLPKGFEETMSYGMIGYVVPHSIFPKGYHCDPKLPLPFVSIAAQKNFVAFYHMGIYANPKLLNWFVEEYPKHTDAKLDMGKGCVRFKNPEKIPYKLLGQLIKKVSVKQWTTAYEENIANYKKK